MQNPYLNSPEKVEEFVKAAVDNTTISDSELSEIYNQYEEAEDWLTETTGVAFVKAGGEVGHRDHTPEEISSGLVTATAFYRAWQILSALQRGEVKLVPVTKGA